MPRVLGHRSLQVVSLFVGVTTLQNKGLDPRSPEFGLFSGRLENLKGRLARLLAHRFARTKSTVTPRSPRARPWAPRDARIGGGRAPGRATKWRATVRTAPPPRSSSPEGLDDPAVRARRRRPRARRLGPGEGSPAQFDQLSKSSGFAQSSTRSTRAWTRRVCDTRIDGVNALRTLATRATRC